MGGGGARGGCGAARGRGAASRAAVMVPDFRPSRDPSEKIKNHGLNAFEHRFEHCQTRVYG